MTVSERIAALQHVMKQNEVDAYFVPTNDFHSSEYVGDYFKCREYLSGFTGSAGTLVVLGTEAGLWTDGRYFLQAERELEGSGITLYRMGEEGVPTVLEFLVQKMSDGQTLGFDGRVVDAVLARKLADTAALKGASVNSSLDLAGEVWQERPEISSEPAYSLDIKYAGVNREEKIRQVCEWMRGKQADMLVLTSLDDIAWLLNIRGGDVHCNPVVMSYLVLTQTEHILFARKESFGEELLQDLAAANVTLQNYDMIYDFISRVPAGTRIAMDLRVVNYAMLQAVPEDVSVLDEGNPTQSMKAKKNSTEVSNERLAHVKDGVAMVRFIYWLKQNMDKMPLTEIRAAEKLEEFRKRMENYIGPSFDPIAGYGEHGAIVHYSATPETDMPLQSENFLLLDTGGHYLEGTTDITRTIYLGTNATPDQKKYYTAVLRGNLCLAAAKFKYGCSGVSLDYLAREPLWEIGCDYNHGTGHGVGYLLNVHEGPNAFRYQVSAQPDHNAVMEEGMITSDEPGIYLEGKFGIRLENLIVCVKKEKTEYGQFMGFEPLTLVPFEREAIEPARMSEREKRLLNQYHEMVYEKISPYLERNEAEWLQDVCAPFD